MNINSKVFPKKRQNIPRKCNLIRCVELITHKLPNKRLLLFTFKTWTDFFVDGNNFHVCSFTVLASIEVLGQMAFAFIYFLENAA